MPRVPPIVAHVDHLGYMFCVDCRPDLNDVDRDDQGYPYPVYGDLQFNADDKCDSCGKQIECVPTGKYIKC